MERLEEEEGYVSKYLSHFVGRKKNTEREKFDLLCDIVNDRRLLPQGNPENWSGRIHIRPWLPFSEEMLLPEMVCFCDLPIKSNVLARHATHYSSFGLAFKKQWVAGRGANPVLYVAQGAACTDHGYDAPRRDTNYKDFFNSAAAEWLNVTNPNPGAVRQDTALWPRRNRLVLWYLLCYCKFYDEKLPDKDQQNYYMEREWRRIGQLKFSWDDVQVIIMPQQGGWLEEFQSRFPDFPASFFPLKT